MLTPDIVVNLSTVEWNVGPLPANVVAIPGTLSGKYDFSNETMVIENASRADSGSRALEGIVFGATSAVVLSWALLFACYNRKTMFSPRGSSIPRANSPISNAPTLLGENEDITIEQFKSQLANFYYPPIRTELEEYEKNVVTESIEAEDVEAATNLLRKMYDLDLGLWSHQNSTHVSHQERERYRDKSDAILAEIRRIINSWTDQQSRRDWTPEESAELGAIVQYLSENIPEKRYGYRTRQY